MKRLYKLIQQVPILGVILFLHGCPGLGHQELFREVEDKKFLTQRGQ